MNFDAACKNFHIGNNDAEEEEAEIDNDEDEVNNNEDNTHEFEDEEEEDEDDDEPDFMDNSGKCWEFASKIGDEKHLKEWCQNKMGGMIVGKEEKLTRQFHCPNKECQFKAIFLKSCSIVYTRNKHKHGTRNVKNIRIKKDDEIENINPTAQPTLKKDYVDRHGKLWHFLAHIDKNVLQDISFNKIGFNKIIKNETTLNLYCQKINPAGGICPIKGIYFKSNGCLYTRGEHEHTKKRKIPQNIGDDYVDNFGKIWKFNKEIGKNIKREIFLNKFGFGDINTTKLGFILHCGKKAPNGRCKFSGIYLNSNGCFYIRGEHQHALAEKNPKPNVGDDFVDYGGKVWPFHSKIGKQNIPDEFWRNKFGLTDIQVKQKTLNLYCKKMTNGKTCPFRGIYVKENGCLYVRGKHEH